MSVKRSDFEKLNEIPINVFFGQENDINIYDITDIFCDEFLCLIGEQGRSFYYDDDHLSTYGALKLQEVINNIFLKDSFPSTN